MNSNKEILIQNCINRMIAKSKEEKLCLKLFLLTILVVSTITFFTACGSQSKESVKDSFNTNNLIGTWVSPDADNQVLEIRTEEIRFNHRTFDYTVKENALYLYQTFPNSGGVTGNMPFELNGDTLSISLGADFEGYFYGRSGTVKLERR